MNKAHILQEIKRTAKANGGIPLGRIKFESETGIKETDWLGKYWARWGEAVREAGFTPNQLTGAYDKNELLEKYAILARELGRLPTSADLRLKTRNDSDFPSNSTFENRFSTKLELVKQLEHFCGSRSQYNDLTHFCAAYVSPSRNSSDEVKIQEGQIGSVYLIKSGHFIKLEELTLLEDGNMKLRYNFRKRHPQFTLLKQTIQMELKVIGTIVLH